MTIAGQAIALLCSLTPDQLRALSRAERQLLSDQCERVNLLVAAAERAAAGHGAHASSRLDEPRSGVLASLKDGERAS